MDDDVESEGFVFAMFVLGMVAVALVGWILWEVML